MAEFYLIAGALLMSGALVLAFRHSAAGAVAAYAGAWALRMSGYSPVSARLLLFWAIAVLIVVSINMARESKPAIPFRARCFIVGGSIAGMAAGLAFYQGGAILGAAAGAALGGVAYMGPHSLRDKRLIGRWIVTVGLPAVVTVSLVAMAIQGILARSTRL